MEAPAISPRAQKTLQDLREGGKPVTDSSVVWLASLAARIDRPAGDELGPLSGAPLIAGGVEFWPLTWLARDWFYKWHELLIESDSPLADYAFAYAHTMSGVGNRSLLKLDSYETAKIAMEAWVRSMPLDADNMAQITSELIIRWQTPAGDDVPNPDNQNADSKSGNAPSSDESLALLASQLGGTPDYWRFDIAMGRTQAMYATLAKSHDSAGGAPDPHSPRIRAIHNYHQAVKWVTRNG
jgi:hypothetical protein